jgi:hypothetical protein
MGKITEENYKNKKVIKERRERERKQKSDGEKGVSSVVYSQTFRERRGEER